MSGVKGNLIAWTLTDSRALPWDGDGLEVWGPSWCQGFFKHDKANESLSSLLATRVAEGRKDLAKPWDSRQVTATCRPFHRGRGMFL